MKELSVIIPAHNEEKRIPKTLCEIAAYLKSRFSSFEIVVVDDGSVDKTYELCRDFFDSNKCGRVLKNSRNRGKGYSVRKGMLSADGRLRLFSDADMSTPIGEIEKLINGINNGYDIAIGSRSIAGSDIRLHQPFYREWMGKIFNFLVQAIALKGIIDTQCGFKLFTDRTANDIFARQISSGFSFDVEALFIAHKLGYRVKEIPVTWINSPESKVSPITDSARMLLDLFLIRTRSLREIYRQGKTMITDEQLHNYYNKSDAYMQLMRSHCDKFFASYLKLVGRYTKGADSLLDVGCGSGASTHTISHKFPFLNCSGIDISKKAIAFASANYHLKNLHFEVSDAGKLRYPDHSFSIVASCDCLEHVRELESVLRELMRVVKPGGYLIIKGPNHMSPLYTLADIMLFRHRYPFTHSWLGNFPRLTFELSHLFLGLTGSVRFIRRTPDLSDTVQTGNDADAVTDMCNLDVYNFLRKANWKILNVSWPRGTSRGGAMVSKLFPLLGSMGVVAQRHCGAD